MKNRVSLQTSDSYITGLLLALSAGFQDAYTYIERNHVFSNAQTGNIVLMGQYIFTHNWQCALQLQSFRKIGDNNYASTMCIGNLRQMVNAFSLYHWSKDRKYLLSAAGYSSVILVFGIGAGICVSFASAYGSRAIIGSCIILLAVFLVMKEEKVLT